MRSVLIYDDEPVIMASVKDKLMELGFRIIFECRDGNSAVTTACETLPDIAILDVEVHNHDGLSAACEIRQKLKIPVILFMSFCDTDTLNRAKENGISTILSKPFRGQDLLPALEMAFARAEEVELLKENVEELKIIIESQEIIDKAKGILMRSQGLSETLAYRKIQKLAMDKQKSMRQISEAILITEGV